MRPHFPSVVQRTAAGTGRWSSSRHRWCWPSVFRSLVSVPLPGSAKCPLFRWPLGRKCGCWIAGCTWWSCWLMHGWPQLLPLWPCSPRVHLRTCLELLLLLLIYNETLCNCRWEGTLRCLPESLHWSLSRATTTRRRASSNEVTWHSSTTILPEVWFWSWQQWRGVSLLLFGKVSLFMLCLLLLSAKFCCWHQCNKCMVLLQLQWLLLCLICMWCRCSF